MRKWMRTIGTTLVAALCSAAMVLPGFAAETSGSKAVSQAAKSVDSIPISIDIKGDMPEEPETFKVVMEAPEESAQYLPGGTSPYTIEVSQNKDGEYKASLPEMKFDRVGVYYYTIYQEQGSIPWAEYDSQCYTLKVTVTNKEGSTTGELEFTAVLRYAEDEEEKDNKKSTVAFTNTYKVGSLTVSKEVYGNKADSQQYFTYTMTLTTPDYSKKTDGASSALTVNYGTLLQKAGYKSSGINGTYDGVTFVNGAATFKLKHGESKTFTQLPAGTTYKITESDCDGYTVSVKVNDGTEVYEKSAEGTIDAGEAEKVAYRNGRSSEDKKVTPPEETTPEPEPITNTTNIAVGKVWSDSDNADGIRPESVTVQLYRNGEAYGNPVTLNEANEWWYRWDNLDKSASWTVDELNVADGYTRSFAKNAVNAWVIVNTHEASAAAVVTPETPDTTNHTNAYTGDESNMMLWLILMIAAGAGAVIGVVIYKKRGSKN
jgi:pilin isopeptide linkage protein